jgi:hypothetical protein
MMDESGTNALVHLSLAQWQSIVNNAANLHPIIFDEWTFFYRYVACTRLAAGCCS